MEITGVLSKIAVVLNKLEIPYAVTGGVAVTIWGRARYTADIDIVIDIAEQKLKELVKELSQIEKGIYLDIDAETPIEFIKKQGGFNLIHSQSGVKADFIIKGKDELSQLELDRAIVKDAWGQKICFISPEDLILIKLLWYKNSGSTRHLEDAESILKITQIDLEYVKEWAKKQKTIDVLGKLLEKIKDKDK